MTDEAAEPEVPQPTSAADWPTKERAVRGFVVELPSGATARLARPPLQYLLATGRVPAALWKRLHTEGSSVLLDPLVSLSESELKTFIDWLICESFLEPQVSLTRKQGVVYIGDVSDADKESVMIQCGLSIGV